MALERGTVKKFLTFSESIYKLAFNGRKWCYFYLITTLIELKQN